MRTRGAISVACAALAVVSAAAGEDEPRAAELLAQAAEHRDRGRSAEAAKICEALVGDARASEAEKVAAWRLLVDALWRDRRHEEALAAARRMAREAPAERHAALLLGDMLRDLSRPAEGLRVLRRFVAQRPDPEAQLRMAEILLRIGRFAECAEEARKASLALASKAPATSGGGSSFPFLGRERTDAERAADALRYVAEASWRGGDPESCAEAISRLLEPALSSGWNEQELRELRRRRAECLLRLGQVEPSREEYLRLADTDPQPRARQEWAFLAAQTLVEEDRLEEAAAAFERVFAASAEPTDFWPRAQRSIVDCLRAEGMHEEALRAGRVLLDTAPHGGALADAARLLAEIFAEADRGAVERANAFALFQRFGPAGRDGKAGTADDPKDPLSPLGHPALEGRARALAELLREPPAAAQGFRRMALASAYLGRSAEAAALYVEAFRRAPLRELREIAHEAVMIGLRGVRGHAAGLEDAFAYVAWGPAGPDGVRGSEDDLADPFAGLSAGVVPALSSDDAETLRAAAAVLEGLVADPALDVNDRREAAWALERLHEATGDWGRAGLREWYIAQLLSTPDGRLQEPLMAGALASARGADAHLGGVRELLRELDGRLGREGKGLSHEAERQRQEAARLADELSKVRRVAPELEPLKPRRAWIPASRSRQRREIPQPRPPDRTPPSAPSGLRAVRAEAGRVELAWAPAADPETGVAFYVLWRDGVELALSSATAFADDGVPEESTRTYQVSAVNGIGMESAPSASLRVTMPRDTTSPRVESVAGAAEPTKLLVTFTEPVDPATASEPANYSLDRGASVLAARLFEDGRTVLLSTSPLVEGATYALEARNIADRARRPNVIAPGSRTEFEFLMEGDGLTGIYYDNIDFTGKSVTRTDPQVNFSWGDGRPHPEIEPDTFSVRWTGRLRAAKSETYTFTARTDDGVRLWVAGRLLIDQWRDQAPTESSGSVELRAGELYDIRMDYYENGGGAEAILYWSNPSTPREVVPKSRLYSRRATGAGEQPAEAR